MFPTLNKPGVVVLGCNPITAEVELGGWEVQGYPWAHGQFEVSFIYETLSQLQEKKKRIPSNGWWVSTNCSRLANQRLLVFFRAWTTWNSSNNINLWAKDLPILFSDYKKNVWLAWEQSIQKNYRMAQELGLCIIPTKSHWEKEKTACEMPDSHAAFLPITSLITFIPLHRNLCIHLSSVTRLGWNWPFPWPPASGISSHSPSSPMYRQVWVNSEPNRILQLRW